MERWSVVVEGEGALLTLSMTVLAAAKQARLRGISGGFVEVSGTVARATGRLEAAGGSAELEAYVAEVTAQAQARAGRDGTVLTITRD